MIYRNDNLFNSLTDAAMKREGAAWRAAVVISIHEP